MIMAGLRSGGRKLYRSRNGFFFGVCRGIAEWRDLPVDLVRIAFIVLNIFGFLPIWIYFILALILPGEPDYRKRKDDYEAEFDDLKDRVGKMEDEEFDKEKDWENRFRSGK